MSNFKLLRRSESRGRRGRRGGREMKRARVPPSSWRMANGEFEWRMANGEFEWRMAMAVLVWSWLTERRKTVRSMKGFHTHASTRGSKEQQELRIKSKFRFFFDRFIPRVYGPMTKIMLPHCFGLPHCLGLLTVPHRFLSHWFVSNELMVRNNIRC